MTHSYAIGVGKVIMGTGVIIHAERHKVGSTPSRALEIQDLLVRSGLDENLRRTQSYVACQSNTESSSKSISSRIGTFEFDSIEQRGTTDTGVSTHRDVRVAFLRGNVAHNAIVRIGPVFVETDAKVTDSSWASGSDGIAECGGLGSNIDCVGTQSHSDWRLSGCSSQSYAGYHN